MKSRIKKAFYALLVIAAFIDWPISSDAQGGARIGKALGKAIEKEESGLFKSCSNAGKAEEKAVQNVNDIEINRAGVTYGASKAVQNSAAQNNTNNSITRQKYTCEACGGTGIGKVNCWDCGGFRIKPCPQCYYKDYTDYDCQCGGSGTINCKTCNFVGTLNTTCEACGGKGFYYANN